MDPLSALAVACAVFQFVDFGVKLVSQGWKWYNHPGEDGQQSDDKLPEIESGLSSLLSGVGEASAKISNSKATTPAQTRLLEVCTDCIRVATDFNRLISRLKAQRAWNADPGAGRQSRVRRLSWASFKKVEDAADQVEFAKVDKQLQTMRREVTDSVILCLWEDSQRTQQWELHFNNQLDGVVTLLRRVDETTQRLHQQGSGHSFYTDEDQSRLVSQILEDLTRDPPVLGVDILGRAGKRTDQLEEVLRPFAKAGQSMSLVNLRAEIATSLGKESQVSDRIQSGLVHLMWKREWKLDSSMTEIPVDETRADVSAEVVATSIADSIQFETIEAREDAIIDRFLSTYDWIFQEEPDKADGKQMWHSFPKWLEDNGNMVYWITGKPGSGKSVMMKSLQLDRRFEPVLSRWAGSLPLLVVTYYAWHPGYPLQKSFEGLKRTVLSQALLLRNDLVSKLTPRRWALCQILRSLPLKGFPEWDEWEIDESFDALLFECGKSIKLALFVDGLDEFQVPARDVVELFRNIRTRGMKGLKICAASRPWTEFDDEFNECPMLEMHMLTGDDMTAFVDGKFRGHRGFEEQKQLYPDATNRLLEEIVKKSDGVFLWVSIVIDHLSHLLKDGYSIANVEKILTDLPPDISSLYDAIWARIHPDNIPDASFMMQVVEAAGVPLPWFTMWVIEESGPGPIDINALPTSDDWKEVALKSLKRKLGSRTKGILEVASSGRLMRGGMVNFIHRTARDWVRQPAVWQRLFASFYGRLDPYLTLLEAETLLLSCHDLNLVLEQTRFWKAMTRVLWYASEGSDSQKNKEELVRLLDLFDSTVIQRHHNRQVQSGYTGTIGRDGRHWSARQRAGLDNTFLGLTAQFSILPYVKAKALSKRKLLSQNVSTYSLGLLESAIFGYTRYMPARDVLEDFQPTIPGARRLATVEFLLDQGVTQSKVRVFSVSQGGRPSSVLLNLKEEVLLKIGDPEDPDYYRKVAEDLEKRDSKRFIKSVSLRVRSW